MDFLDEFTLFQDLENTLEAFDSDIFSFEQEESHSRDADSIILENATQLCLLPPANLTSVKHFVYNEIVKYYLGETTFVLPLASMIDRTVLVDQFYITVSPETSTQIAEFCVKCKYGLKNPFKMSQINHAEVQKDLIAFYNKQFFDLLRGYFVGINTEYGPTVRTTIKKNRQKKLLFKSPEPIFIVGETFENAAKRLRGIPLLRKRKIENQTDE